MRRRSRARAEDCGDSLRAAARAANVERRRSAGRAARKLKCRNRRSRTEEAGSEGARHEAARRGAIDATDSPDSTAPAGPPAGATANRAVRQACVRAALRRPHAFMRYSASFANITATAPSAQTAAT
ncbi:hypothetical protein WS86_20455 [Burkholderia savannae]|nr:hypothetical protein WS86_20455 [Burkholderia savannae]